MTAKYKRLYRYYCQGCNKRRFTVRFERQKMGLCLKCSPKIIPENQMSLFS